MTKQEQFLWAVQMLMAAHLGAPFDEDSNEPLGVRDLFVVPFVYGFIMDALRASEQLGEDEAIEGAIADLLAISLARFHGDKSS